MRSACLLALLILAACGPADAPAALSDAERLALAPDTASGQRLFRQCGVCHEAREGTGHRVGPNLWGVVGASAARHGDFRYSQAMARSGIVWEASALDAYLADPQGYLPGNRMGYQGMSSEADRRDVIAYLQTLDD